MHEGWLYLCVVIDLFSRRVVGFVGATLMTKDVALQARLMAVWRRTNLFPGQSASKRTTEFCRPLNSRSGGRHETMQVPRSLGAPHLTSKTFIFAKYLPQYTYQISRICLHLELAFL